MKAFFKPIGVALLAIALLAGCNNKPKTIDNNNANKPENTEATANNSNSAATNTANSEGGPTEFSGSIENNVTWPDLGLDVDYIVDGWININGNALLTIEPGVTIMFTGANGGIGVGENAGLRMVGTAEKPIILEGPTNNSNNGSWQKVRIESKRNDNQFEYVQFLRGGSDEGEWQGVVHLANGRLGMKNCLIDGSLGMGLVIEYDEGFLTAFENNTIKNCSAYPWLSEYFLPLTKNIGSGNIFENNGKNMVCCKNSGTDFQENTTIRELPIPYYFPIGVSFDGNKTVTIEPGVKFMMPINTGIGVGDECGFVANGTEEKPIVFFCEEEGEAWNGIRFDSKRNNNVINYCQFKNCGANDSWGERSCLYIRSEAKLTLTNNVFGPSFYNGVGIENIENWGKVTHSGNTFVNCKEGNVWIEGGGEYNGTEYEGGKAFENLPQ